MLTRSQWEKEEAQGRERKLQEEMALHQEKLADGQEAFRQACERALEARVRDGQEAAGGERLGNMHAFQQVTALPFRVNTESGVPWWPRVKTPHFRGPESGVGSLGGKQIPQAARHGHTHTQSVCYIHYTLIKGIIPLRYN